MPVRRMTIRQAVDYFNSLETDSSGSEDEAESTQHAGGDAALAMSNDEQNSDLSDGEVVVEHADDSDNSDTSSDSSDVESDGVTSDSANYFTAPNELRWNLTSPPPRRLMRDILNFRPGVTFSPRSEEESFLLLLDENILRTILLYTNRRMRASGKTVFTFAELKAGIAILIRSGADKDNLSDLSTLFSPYDSRPFYRCAMSKNRFRLFLRYLTFDNKGDRRQRQVSDKMAAIREIWDLFQMNIRKFYVPSERITVDEQLYGYRGYSPGRCYMSSKPAKYGIKFFWLCDAKNGYALAGTIYSGKASDGRRETGLAEKTVVSLTSFYNKSGRNVFVDRYFTSHSLCLTLLQNGLTMTGTIMASRRDVPKELKTVKDRSLYSTTELWDGENRIMLLSYVPKKGKNVLLMSSAHSSAGIQTEREDKKPAAIHDYNQGKGGVDVLDSCIEDFTTKRKTNRYPLVIFFNILDVSVYNGFLLCKESESAVDTKCRRQYMKRLAAALAKDNMSIRMQNPRVFSQSKESFARFGLFKEAPTTMIMQNEDNKRPKQCSMCRRTTRSSCDTCKKRICTVHKITTIQCLNCICRQ